MSIVFGEVIPCGECGGAGELPLNDREKLERAKELRRAKRAKEDPPPLVHKYVLSMQRNRHSQVERKVRLMPTFNARTAGIYRATYQGCKELTYTDKETGEDETRWVWKFQEVNDPLSTGEIEKLTGTSMSSPNSNAYIMAAGIVGRKLQPGDDTEAHIGEPYDVVYGPNRAGTLTITSVVKVAGATTATAPVPEVPLTALPNQVADLP